MFRITSRTAGYAPADRPNRSTRPKTLSNTDQKQRDRRCVGIPVADLTAGLLCAPGMLTALLERDVSRQGHQLRTSLLQAQIFLLDF